MKWLTLLMSLLGALSYVQADCYPGDTAYTQIVQEIYHGVTSDNIHLTAHGGGALSRQSLCNTLVNRHNSGKNPQQPTTNQVFLGTSITAQACVNALTYTQGYNSLSGWQAWAGYHSGTWYSTSQTFQDGAQWDSPTTSYGQGHTYSFQKVRFDSQYRINNCVSPDMTGATCRFGWNQAGTGIQYVWGWDPKDNNCPSGYLRGRSGGAHVGFTFTHNSASCIVWVTNQEAFLECVKNGHRTSTASGYPGYGQWTK